MAQIAGDSLTKVADENWSAAAQLRGQLPAFNPTLVEEIYKRELNGISKLPPKLKRVMLLEISQYLENYLWPNFDAETASDAHILSILVSSPVQQLLHEPKHHMSTSAANCAVVIFYDARDTCGR